MFSMLTFKMKPFCAYVEADLADKIHPHMPQQTMTLSRVETQNHFYGLTKPSSHDGMMRLFI
ncbi:hypothetical protein K470DRAFT_256009 [Piedraia hortae CBS 480.64]|uniref:Uncharacterized protein n=1 Tax=Piedraia hortae CBS 480.64 TaxID=1314780 RepID=A0A6A7C4H9_9PEZI|nr:hypothetical protein K470DRAFT_256009 [Piedraia hortae CBS 480.64]